MVSDSGNVSKEWNWIDKCIAAFRYAKVNPYVDKLDSVGVVVDVGCGREGAFLKAHSQNMTHGYGFDFRIQSHEDGNLSFINNKDLNGTFPLQNDTVDAVFLNAVLEHLDNPNEVIAEAARVLRPGGRIVMTTPTRMAKPVLEFLAYTLHVINEDEIREHKHYFNKSDINNLVAAINGADTSALVSLERYSFFELGLNSLIVLRKI